MAIETKVWDATEVLNSPADTAVYLEHDIPKDLLRTLRTIAGAQG